MTGKVAASSPNGEEVSPSIPALVEDLQNFFWLVGLCEGEAYFGFEKSRRCPRLSIQMTDEATVARAASLLGVSHWAPKVRGSQRQATYRADLQGKPALALMRRMYPHLCPRRQAQIRAIERAYVRTHPDNPLPLVKSLIKSKLYSVLRVREEAA